MRVTRAVVLLLFLALLAFWVLTWPMVLPPGVLPDHSADLENGQQLFWAGGCASCHADQGAEGEDRLRLAGGLELDTDFGLFRVPNISSDPESGIGAWSDSDFINAMKYGVSPTRRHYYPSFPYTSYLRMSIPDLMDLKAFLDTLPAVSFVAGEHELRFPFNIRRGLGLWKMLYLNSAWVIKIDDGDALLRRGRDLVEGPGHCAECHTPRDWLGGLETECWLAGAPNLDDEGDVPNITPTADGLASWSQSDLAYYLESGFTPDYDSVGGAMVDVQENMAMLEDPDRNAIAAYLKALPAIANTCRDDGA